MHLSLKLTLLALVPAGVLGAELVSEQPCCTSVCTPEACTPQAPAESTNVRGRYVEARSASVFAGPCHFNGEYTTTGREALLAWHLERGVEAGVSLAGVELVAAVRADRNLAEPEARRESVVYLDADLAPEVRAAARAWLEREHADVLGRVLAVKTGAVRVESDGERFAVEALDLVALSGEAMPDRACCSMPSNVWYAAEVELDGRLVGFTEEFVLADPDLGPRLVRRAENSAILGALAAR